MKIITAILYCQIVLGLIVAILAYGHIHSAAMGMEYSRAMQQELEQLKRSSAYEEPPALGGKTYARLIEDSYTGAWTLGKAALLAFITGLGSALIAGVLLWLYCRVRRKVYPNMKLPPEVSGAIRTFSYFLASGTHNMLEGVPYLGLYGKEPGAIEQAYAIFANVLEVDEGGRVTNRKHAEKRATDYLRRYCDPAFRVEPPFEDWELELH